MWLFLLVVCLSIIFQLYKTAIIVFFFFFKVSCCWWGHGNSYPVRNVLTSFAMVKCDHAYVNYKWMQTNEPFIEDVFFFLRTTAIRLIKWDEGWLYPRDDVRSSKMLRQPKTTPHCSQLFTTSLMRLCSRAEDGMRGIWCLNRVRVLIWNVFSLGFGGEFIGIGGLLCLKWAANTPVFLLLIVVISPSPFYMRFEMVPTLHQTYGSRFINHTMDNLNYLKHISCAMILEVWRNTSKL